MKNAVVINLPAIGIKEVEVGFPNIGQTLRIESYKQIFTGGKYAQLTYNSMSTTEAALDVVDAIAYLGVMIGEERMAKAFEMPNLGGVAELFAHDERIQELLEQYRTVYEPFFNEINPRTDRTRYRLKKKLEEVGVTTESTKKDSAKDSEKK